MVDVGIQNLFSNFVFFIIRVVGRRSIFRNSNLYPEIITGAGKAGGNKWLL